MLRQRNAGTVLTGVSVWLAVVLLAIAAGLIYTELVSAQESSTEAALSAPVLSAEAGAGEGTVELRWEAVTGAVRYELLAWTSGADDWQDIGGDNLTGTTFSHTGLAAGTTYYYTVRAVGAGGETGDWSAYASVTVAAALSTPVLTAEGGESAVALRWEAVSGAARYALWVWTAADGWQRLDDGALTGTIYSHTGLAAGTTYYYTVRAVGAGGEMSDWSAFVASVTAPPAATATVTATARAPVRRALPQQDSTATATATTTATPTMAPSTATATATARVEIVPPADTPTATATPRALPQQDSTATATRDSVFGGCSPGPWGGCGSPTPTVTPTTAP